MSAVPSKDDGLLPLFEADNGPASNGWRTPFFRRMLAFADHSGQSIRLLDALAFHSKDNPVARCRRILEKHCNSAKLSDTRSAWVKRMRCKGVHPVAEPSRTVYRKGIIAAKKAMPVFESRSEPTRSWPSGTS